MWRYQLFLTSGTIVRYSACTGRHGLKSTLKPLRSQVPLARYGIVIGSAGALSALYVYSKNGKKESPLPQEQASFVSQQNSNFSSTLPALSLKEAEEKLRAVENSGKFGSSTTGEVIFHYLRLPSNSPVEDDLVQAEVEEGKNAKLQYWGVFDGHVGWATSTALRKYLVPYVHRQVAGSIDDSETFSKCVKEAFLKLDGDIFSNAAQSIESATVHTAETISALEPATAGSCALLAIFDPKQSILRVANVGDSRAVLGRYDESSGKYMLKEASKDQTGFNEDEVARLLRDHPGEEEMISKSSGRVLGMAISRAFGDHRWKWTEKRIQEVHEKFAGPRPRPNTKSPPYLTAEPVVTEVTVNRGSRGDFLILASDGLWDHISSEDAVECVSRWVTAARNSKTGRLENSGESEKIDDGGMEMDNGYAYWKSEPRHFVTEEENAATHLAKNAFGGSRRSLFRAAMSACAPSSRNIRDDITIQVIFFSN